MKLLLLLCSLLMLSVSCSTPKEEYQEEKAQAEEEYNEEMEDIEEEYKEEQKEEAVDYVEDSEEAKAKKDESKVDVIEE